MKWGKVTKIWNLNEACGITGVSLSIPAGIIEDLFGIWYYGGLYTNWYITKNLWYLLLLGDYWKSFGIWYYVRRSLYQLLLVKTFWYLVLRSFLPADIAEMLLVSGITDETIYRLQFLMIYLQAGINYQLVLLITLFIN